MKCLQDLQKDDIISLINEDGTMGTIRNKVTKVTEKGIYVLYNQPGSLWHLSTIVIPFSNKYHYTGLRGEKGCYSIKLD